MGFWKIRVAVLLLVPRALLRVCRFSVFIPPPSNSYLLVLASIILEACTPTENASLILMGLLARQRP